MPHSDLDQFVIRKLWPGDFAAFRRHLKRLDAETRQLRFGMAVNDDFLAAYADTAHRLGTVVFGAFQEGEIRAAAELRALDLGDEAMAEAAFTVERPWQDHGLGTELLNRVITTAQNRGIDRIYMICLKENGRMQHIAGKFGARLSADPDAVTGSIAPAGATPASTLDEGLHDVQGFVTAMLEWPRQMFRPAG